MKINKPQSMIVLLSLIILFIVWMKYQKSFEADNAATVEINNTIEMTAGDESYLTSDASTYTTAAASTDEIPDQYQLDIPYISQYPQLPTGCEITSLAMVLNYYGYSIDKEDLARNYLPMKSVQEDGCYINYFYGSPWSKNGSGCFSPAITTAANKYFSAVDSSYRAETLSYSAVKTLLAEVASGNPVVVWSSFNFDDTEVTYRDITFSNGQTFSWPENEHCIVLSGYNLDDNTVTIADPARGILTHSMDEFTYFYQKYYYQAVVIRTK